MTLQLIAKCEDLLEQHRKLIEYHDSLRITFERVVAIEDRFCFGNKRCKALRRRIIGRSRQVFAEAKALYQEYLSLTERSSDG